MLGNAATGGAARDGACYVFMPRMVALFPFCSLNWLMSMTPLRTKPFALLGTLALATKPVWRCWQW